MLDVRDRTGVSDVTEERRLASGSARLERRDDMYEAGGSKEEAQVRNERSEG